MLASTCLSEWVHACTRSMPGIFIVHDKTWRLFLVYVCSMLSVCPLLGLFWVREIVFLRECQWWSQDICLRQTFAMMQVSSHETSQDVKGTLRRRLSHGYFSFIAKYTSSWLMSHRSHPQIITFKAAEPNFLAWRGEIWSMLWNLIQLLIATHHFMNHVSSFPLTQVWIYAT